MRCPRFHGLLIWLSLCCAAGAVAPALARADSGGGDPATAGPGPLTAQQRATIYGSAEDSLDKKPCEPGRKRVTLACRDQMHYLTTNEWYHQIWRPYIDGVGGAYVGVGADQGLTFIAWARSEIAFMMDYDPEVVFLNNVHVGLIKHSPDAATFVARWDAPGRAAALELLEKEYASHPDQALILRSFRSYGRSIARHWKRVLKRKWSASHWLHHPDWYAYLHRLTKLGRLRVLKGDLLKDKTLRGIGAATHKLKIPMRVVYTSNAEEFWPYPKDFRENFTSMLMDDKSVVLRTRHSDKYGPRIGAYVYIVQDGQDFQTKLKNPEYKGLWVIMRDRTPGRQGFFTIGPVELVKPEHVPPQLTPPLRKAEPKQAASEG